MSNPSHAAPAGDRKAKRLNELLDHIEQSAQAALDAGDEYGMESAERQAHENALRRVRNTLVREFACWRCGDAIRIRIEFGAASAPGQT